MLLMLAACCKTPSTNAESDIEAESNGNVITFVTLNSPNTYYLNSDKEYAGLENDLAEAFIKYINSHKRSARESNKQLKFVVADSIEHAINKVVHKKADIVAADLTITNARKGIIDYAIPYQDVQQQVIYSKSFTRKPAKNISGLIGKEIVVPAATSFVERLQKIKRIEPELTWTERKAVDSETLIEQLAYGSIEYTVADSHLVSALQNHYPNLRVAFSLGDPEKIAWGFTKSNNPQLLLEANAFFSHIKHNGTLRNLIDRYHGNSKRLNPVDIKTFLARRNTRLPQYVKLFKEAQEITGLDWRLLAALSYQESHWDTFNTSPTNVRGLMMLTEVTSDRMGVTDRLDPKQSIPAGAKYVNLMIDTIPDRVPEPDRTYMALASYNIGYAHVEDARVLAQRLGLSPDSWVDVKKALLKLKDPKHYSKAKYGYCRCAQPIIYVESIRSYYNIMTRIDLPHEPHGVDPFKIAGR